MSQGSVRVTVGSLELNLGPSPEWKEPDYISRHVTASAHQQRQAPNLGISMLVSSILSQGHTPTRPDAAHGNTILLFFMSR